MGEYPYAEGGASATTEVKLAAPLGSLLVYQGIYVFKLLPGFVLDRSDLLSKIRSTHVYAHAREAALAFFKQNPRKPLSFSRKASVEGPPRPSVKGPWLHRPKAPPSSVKGPRASVEGPHREAAAMAAIGRRLGSTADVTARATKPRQETIGRRLSLHRSKAPSVGRPFSRWRPTSSRSRGTLRRDSSVGCSCHEPKR